MAFIRFIQKNIVTLNLMMERSGMSEMDIYNRTRNVCSSGGANKTAVSPPVFFAELTGGILHLMDKSKETRIFTWTQQNPQ